MNTADDRSSPGITPFKPNPAVLPLEELQQLVLHIIHRDDIASFLRRMVILFDALKLGQTDKLAHVARQSTDPAFARLISALSTAVEQGDLIPARITVFLAAGYAYQQTLDYYWDLMDCLDNFREH